MKKCGRRAGGCQRRRDLASDESGLADTGHDDSTARLENELDGSRELLTETLLDTRQRFTLLSEHAPTDFEDSRTVFRAHRGTSPVSVARTATYRSQTD